MPIESRNNGKWHLFVLFVVNVVLPLLLLRGNASQTHVYVFA